MNWTKSPLLALPTIRQIAYARGMAHYRIFPWKGRNIEGRDDFEAEGDDLAMAIARDLFDACSDRCEYFNLWNGDRRVDRQWSTMRSLRASESRQVTPNDVRARIQELVIEREEVIKN